VSGLAGGRRVDDGGRAAQLRNYPHEARAGRVPGLEQLLAAHPDLRDAALFAGHDG